jgi:small subunit ribosomal protein S20
MNKKQRNRKTVQQNRRNRIINKRYSTSTKSLTKLFLNKIKSISNVENNNYISEIKLQAKEILNKFYSMIDKAVKKGIVHKNTAARKKSRFDKIYKSI